MTIFLVVGSFSVEGRLSLLCGGGVTALGAMIVVGTEMYEDVASVKQRMDVWVGREGAQRKKG